MATHDKRGRCWDVGMRVKCCRGTGGLTWLATVTRVSRRQDGEVTLSVEWDDTHCPLPRYQQDGRDFNFVGWGDSVEGQRREAKRQAVERQSAKQIVAQVLREIPRAQPYTLEEMLGFYGLWVGIDDEGQAIVGRSENQKQIPLADYWKVKL